jgi:hypothetical protein
MILDYGKKFQRCMKITCFFSKQTIKLLIITPLCQFVSVPEGGKLPFLTLFTTKFVSTPPLYTSFFSLK